MNGALRIFSARSDWQRSRFVHEGFAAAAPFYDALTRLFSLGLDGRWRRCCLDACQLRPSESLLDVATGTGELVIVAANRVSPRGRVAALDACREMLVEARRKFGHTDDRIAWVQGKAESLPFKDEQFDCLTVGFALRHITDLVGTLKEMVRVLKPGGRLAVVEFTRPESAPARWLLFTYLSVVVPPLVGLLSRSWLTFRLARYLPMSIARFVSGEGLRHRLEDAGLVTVGSRRFLAGLVSVCVGVKPDLIA
ncbi:MAG: ubiquinone/menaquinone biosynthesis methyltransferase [Candidatus Methylomirabilis sp.]